MGGPAVAAVAPIEEAPAAGRAGAAEPLDPTTEGGCAAVCCDDALGAAVVDPVFEVGAEIAGGRASAVALGAVPAGAASADAVSEAFAGNPDGDGDDPAAAAFAPAVRAVGGVCAASASELRTQFANSSITAGVPSSLNEYVCPSASRANFELRRKAVRSFELSGSETSSNCPFGMLARPSTAGPSSRASFIAVRAVGVSRHLGLISPSHQRYPPVTSTNKFIPLS
jgi:hypothetical protein